MKKLITVSLAGTMILFFACTSPGDNNGNVNNADSLDNMDNASTMDTALNLDGWPAKNQETANAMIKKYGSPDEHTPSMLVWMDNGPWKKTVIYNKSIEHNFPVAHTDFMEQYIEYKVPLNMYSTLAQYDGSVMVERTTGLLSARCDVEAHNLIALNLANEIITGKKTVQQARDFFGKTVLDEMKGTSSPYLEKLLFDGSMANAADPDEVTAK